MIFSINKFKRLKFKKKELIKLKKKQKNVKKYKKVVL